MDIKNFFGSLLSFSSMGCCMLSKLDLPQTEDSVLRARPPTVQSLYARDKDSRYFLLRWLQRDGDCGGRNASR
jgi:hypothetical protein